MKQKRLLIMSQKFNNLEELNNFVEKIMKHKDAKNQ